MAYRTLSRAALGAFLLTAALTAQDPVTPPVGGDDPGKPDENPLPQVVALGEITQVKFELADIDGKVFSSEQLKKGKPTVMIFWSIKCPIQQAWEDRLPKIVERYREQGVQFLMVNSNEANGEITPSEEGEDRYPQLRKYLKEKELPYRVLIDRNHVVADLFKAKTTPDVFVFDGKGRFVYRGLISNNLKKDKEGDDVENYLTDTLKELLAGRDVEPKATKPYGCTIKRVSGGRGRGRGDGKGKGRRGGGGE